MDERRRQPRRDLMSYSQVFDLYNGTLIGYLTFHNSQRAVNALAGQLHTAVTDRIQERLDGYLATPHLINELNLDGVRLEQLKLQDLDRLGRHFMTQIQRSFVGQN